MNKIKNIIGIAAGLVLAIGPYTFLHVCGANMKMDSDMGGMDMGSMAGGPPCQGIPAASLITGSVLILVSVISLIAASKNKNNSNFGYETVLDLARIILGVIAIDIPTYIIGVCSSAHMHCNMVTKPALIIIGTVIAVTGVISLVYNFITNAKDRDSVFEKVTSEA